MSSDFTNLYDTALDEGAIDDITVAAVGLEPATTAVLGITGLCLLHLVRRHGS